MRSAAASFFLFVYLFANTELHQLVKAPAFVGHYVEHKQEDPNMTLAEFIKIHYFSGNIKDADYAQDMQLPFKTTDCSIFSASHTVPPFVFCALFPVVAMEPTGLPLYDQSALPSSHLADIWQPPKAA